MVTTSLLLIAAALFTFAAIHLVLCFGKHGRPQHALFTLAAVWVGVYALAERALAMTDSPEAFARVVWWGHTPGTFGIISLAVFAYVYLNAGRLWLLILLCGARGLGWILNLAEPVNLNYLTVDSIGKVTILGESLTYGVGVPNPLMLVAQVGLLLFLLYCADIAISIWRRGEHASAIFLGSALFGLSAMAFSVAIPVLWGLVQLPLLVSPFFLGILIAMGYDLTRKVAQAEEFSEELTHKRADLLESIRQLELAAGAAEVGVWTRSIDDNIVYASSKWCALFEFKTDEPISFAAVFDKIHPDDREMVLDAFAAAKEITGEYNIEYRIVTAVGAIKWIGSHGVVDYVNGRPGLVRGASVDITKRKLAEGDAYEFSRKLMGAQEKERSRLARELHDDLSQSLALLAIQLEVLGSDAEAAPGLQRRIADLNRQIAEISSDVHRLSHELHPSKLEQLGLVSAVRGFCREIAASHGLKIQFESDDVPSNLGNEVSLCLYRITQEALRNVAKHSGASIVNVRMTGNHDRLSLTIADNGSGFDLAEAQNRGTLGLVSMTERIRAVNGTVIVDSVVGSGTIVKVEVGFPETDRRNGKQ